MSMQPVLQALWRALLSDVGGLTARSVSASTSVAAAGLMPSPD